MKTLLPAWAVGVLWNLSLQPVQVGDAFNNLKGGPAVRPVFHRLSRYTQPEKDLQLLHQPLDLHLPAQPPPRIAPADVVKTSA